MKAAKYLLFWLIALTLLFVGCLGAQALWGFTHHRYDEPESGYYYGSVHARFDNFDDGIYFLSLEGKSEARWQWSYSSNFTYRHLHIKWNSYHSPVGGSWQEGGGTLRLPSFAYESSNGTGILTRAVLSQWLLGDQTRTPEAARSIDALFGFMEDAAHGTLPAPNHHGHSFKQPVSGQIQHFRLGFGVGGLVYIWGLIWLFLVVHYGRQFWRRQGGP
jgi:hypothetical protein